MYFDQPLTQFKCFVGPFTAIFKFLFNLHRCLIKISLLRYDLFMKCFDHVSNTIDEIYKSLARNQSAQVKLFSSNFVLKFSEICVLIKLTYWLKWLFILKLMCDFNSKCVLFIVGFPWTREPRRAVPRRHQLQLRCSRKTFPGKNKVYLSDLLNVIAWYLFFI